MLLHERDEARALSVAIIILLQLNDVLGVLGEGGVVSAATVRAFLAQPAPRLHDGVPVLHYTLLFFVCVCVCVGGGGGGG